MDSEHFSSFNQRDCKSKPQWNKDPQPWHWSWFQKEVSRKKTTKLVEKKAPNRISRLPCTSTQKHTASLRREWHFRNIATYCKSNSRPNHRKNIIQPKKGMTLQKYCNVLQKQFHTTSTEGHNVCQIRGMNLLAVRSHIRDTNVRNIIR